MSRDEEAPMSRYPIIAILFLMLVAFAGSRTSSLVSGLAAAAEQASSYMPVVIKEPFDKIVERMKAAKPGIEAEHKKLLEERYDLSDKPATGVTMSGGKAVQGGV